MIRIRRKGFSNFSGSTSEARVTANLQASSPHREPMTFHDGLQILTGWKPASGMRQQTSYPSAALPVQVMSQLSSVDQLVMDQFTQMKTMLIYILGHRQETTGTAFCNYLVFKVENVKERNFQTFCNEVVKLLSGIHNRAEERNRQPWQPTFSRSSSTV